MLGILLIYFIGKYFYELAGKHEKSEWGFAILGVISYYVGTFLFGIILAVGMELWSSSSIEDINDILISLMALPFGLMACAGLYFLLKKSWEDQEEYLD